MGHQDTRERIAGELFVTAVHDAQILRIDRGADGRGEELEFKERMVEAIAIACVQAADELIRALDRESHQRRDRDPLPGASRTTTQPVGTP